MTHGRGAAVLSGKKKEKIGAAIGRRKKKKKGVGGRCAE
uniref:Uncharacterized protein n=1 Tax=Cucumis melo TaxID=3656 RepID=A0A9I9E2U1_CUCME